LRRQSRVLRARRLPGGVTSRWREPMRQNDTGWPAVCQVLCTAKCMAHGTMQSPTVCQFNVATHFPAEDHGGDELLGNSRRASGHATSQSLNIMCHRLAVTAVLLVVLSVGREGEG
jgi:hypothetical protein